MMYRRGNAGLGNQGRKTPGRRIARYGRGISYFRGSDEFGNESDSLLKFINPDVGFETLATGTCCTC